MRVLLLGTDVYSKGGIQRYTRYQYKALEEILGVDNVFLFSLSKEDRVNRFETPIRVAYTGTGAGFISKILYALNVILFVKKNNIDVIICAHIQVSILALISKKIFKIKYLINVYGLEIWSGLRQRELRGLLSSDGLIGDCNFIVEYISSNFEYQNPMHLLYDPVDLKKFNKLDFSSKFNEKYQIQKDKFVIMTVGRLDRNKGHEVIINSLKSLPNHVIYVIVGGGVFENSLKNLAKSNNLTERVIFTGRIPEDDLVPAYNSSDVIALLSVFSKNEGEGLPLGLIEASACSKPIVCGNQDGSREAYNSYNANGFMIDPDDINAFVETIKIYINNPQLVDKHGESGRKYASQYFSYKGFVKELKNIVKRYNNAV
jgi:phosphatidyl-myo-inositol dimannoside synthase